MDVAIDSRRRFQRYVAMGDSSTEGLNDPDGFGGYRGWSRRLAARIAANQGGLHYANLGVRGLTTRQIRDRQLGTTLAWRPDLVTLFSGTNDVLRRRFEPAPSGATWNRCRPRWSSRGRRFSRSLSLT